MKRPIPEGVNAPSLATAQQWHEVLNHGGEKEDANYPEIPESSPQISTPEVGGRDEIPDILPHIIQSGFAMTNREEDIAREFFERGWMAAVALKTPRLERR